MRNLVMLVLGLIVVLLAALSVNQEKIALKFAIWQTPYEISVYWWLLAAFGLGFFISLINTFLVNASLRIENRQLKKSLEEAARSGKP